MSFTRWFLGGVGKAVGAVIAVSGFIIMMASILDSSIFGTVIGLIMLVAGLYVYAYGVFVMHQEMPRGSVKVKVN